MDNVFGLFPTPFVRARATLGPELVARLSDFRALSCLGANARALRGRRCGSLLVVAAHGLNRVLKPRTRIDRPAPEHDAVGGESIGQI
jgi:hypothetical protein